MIIHNVEQGTDEWRKSRIGIPTASEFDKIITPTGDQSKQWEAYAHKILAEEMLGHPIETYQSQAMIDGTAREAESVAFYEFQKDVVCQPVGFITDDERTMGCSPDRLVGDDGLLETKNPLAHTHVAYLINGKVGKEYWPQVQGALLITGRKWIDVMSHFPELPPQIIRVTRDDGYLSLMRQYLMEFSKKLDTKRQQLIKLGHMQKAA